MPVFVEYLLNAFNSNYLCLLLLLLNPDIPGRHPVHIGGGVGGRGGLSLLPLPLYLTYTAHRIKVTTYVQYTIHNRRQNTEYRIQKLMYKKLPMDLFFYMDFDAGKSIARAIGRGGP
jgi:hypothetical protein